MSRAKKASKRKSRACAVPLLGAAGLSLSMVSGAPAATVGPTAHEITLGEEEISDVSLATFYVFDKENVGGSEPGVQLVGHGGGGCRHGGGGGCHHGGGGCHHGGCGGCHHRGCGGCHHGRLRRLRRHLVGRLRWLWRLWRLFGGLLVLAERCSDLVLLLITGSPSEPLCPKSPSSTGTSPPPDMYARG